MTRYISPIWLEELLEDTADAWTTATTHAYLLDDTTGFDPTLDLFLGDIPGGERVSGPVVLTTKSATGSFFTADPITFTLMEGIVAEWLVVVRVGGSEATSPVIIATDERADGTPLLYTGNGGTITFHPQAAGLGRI
jgi:hypothetical protein